MHAAHRLPHSERDGTRHPVRVGETSLQGIDHHALAWSADQMKRFTFINAKTGRWMTAYVVGAAVFTGVGCHMRAFSFYLKAHPKKKLNHPLKGI